MSSYAVRILPIGHEGEPLAEEILLVAETDLFTWNFGKQYSDFTILEIKSLAECRSETC